MVWANGQPTRFLPYSFNGQGLRAFGKNPAFVRDPRFCRAYSRGWNSGHKKAAHIDDARWTVHVALWAASRAAQLSGDFVECGVDTGMLSLAICDWLDFNKLDRDFWLFDTFRGIPEEQMTEAERTGIGGWHNQHSYVECYERAVANFAAWPRCRLVRGVVPDSLAAFHEERRVAYLSIDMNIVAPEIAAINFFWERLVPGAIVLLDDYAWASHTAQKVAFDEFAAAHGAMILSLPTGQGLLIR